MSFYLLKTQSDGLKYAYIDGSSGKYDNKIKHPHVRYGRNAISNYEKYIAFRTNRLIKNTPTEDSFEKAQEIPPETSVQTKRKKARKAAPFKFELKYMPGTVNYLSLNTMALIGASFQEMGRKTNISKEKLAEILKNKFKNSVGIEKEEINTKVLDINDDDKIDVGEYAASVLASDMLSRGTSGVKLDNIRGSINNDGICRLSKLFDEENEEKGRKVFNLLYSFFYLNSYKNKVIFDKNSTKK